jgi:hypothetical protein
MRYSVYEYGCRAPIGGEGVALEQMRLRVEFWNALFAIEQEHIARTRELLVSEVDDRIKSIGRDITELVSQLKARSRSRSAAAMAERRELRSRLEMLKASMKGTIGEARQSRRKIIEERRAALSTLDEQRKAGVKAARAKAGLYWCNADEVIKLYEDARIRAMKMGTSVGSRQWRGSGTVSVKYQKGLSPSLLPRDTRFQIDPVDEQAWADPRRRVRRRLCRTVARIRVSSTEERHPIWLELPMVMHRPLAENILIRSVRVKRFRVGTEYRYKLLITVRETDSISDDGHSTAAGSVGVLIGFRRTAGGIRVGYWADHAGDHGELLLPTELISQFDKVDDLRSRVDQNWNDTRNELAAWLGKSPIPDWLRDATQDLPGWMDYHRPLSLVELWSRHRFSGGEDIFRRLIDWRSRHLHLYAWASHLRDQTQLRRREMFRLMAVHFARTYGDVYIRSLTKPAAGSPAPVVRPAASKENDEARMRGIGALGILRKTLLQTCEREAVSVHAAPPAELNHACPACGRRHHTSGDEQAMTIRCLPCGTTWDRDHAEAVAILNSGHAA